MIRGQVPQFQSIDLELLSFTLDGNTIETAPSKGAYDVSITCNNGAEGYWNYEEWGPQIKNITKKTKCSIAFTTGKYMSDYVISLSNSNISHVEKIEHEATEQTPALTDYRYVGANPNNYVYFGCSDSCTEDNLYRIIGVIPTQSTIDGEYENRVKLIKNDFYFNENDSTFITTGYYWNLTGHNDWTQTDLNINVLNGSYFNSLSNYQDFIAPAVWYLGAPTGGGKTTNKSEDFYKLERGNIPGSTGYSVIGVTNIGLMYPSDYGYSLGLDFQNQAVNTNPMTNSWFYKDGSHEWTMTPEPTGYSDKYHSHTAWNIWNNGLLEYSVSVYANELKIRPVFYLKANIQYSSGDGTIENPYRIA